MKYIIGICLLFFVLSCSSKTEKPAKVLLKEEKTFPFSEADKIEVISYDVRNMWDTLNTVGLVKNKRLNIDTQRIEERVVLNKKLKKELFNFLFNEDCGDGGSVASCFDPRHSVLFYNKNNEIIAYFEVCLDCATAQTSPDFDYNEICYERIGNLRNIFKEAGITYFEENE